MKLTALLIIYAMLLCAGYHIGYAVRDSQIESAVVRHWVERYESKL